MTLHLTPAESERIAAAGSGVLFREGRFTPSHGTAGHCCFTGCALLPCGCCSRSLDPGHHLEPIPPAEFVEAAAACGTCGGSGSIEGRNIASWDICYADDCHDGKRRVAVVVPCDHVIDGVDGWWCGCGDGLTDEEHNTVGACATCAMFDRGEPCTGLVTVGHVVVTSGPDLQDDTTYSLGVEVVS